MPSKLPAGARDRILDAASHLFDSHGVHAVGMQRIISEAGCGKHLLYAEFGSKDELVAAYLRRSERSWEQTLKATLAMDAEPEEQVVELVRLAAYNVPGTRGCPIRNTFREFPDEDHLVHQVAMAHFEVVREQLCELTRRTAAADPERLADRILLIINGLFGSGSVLSVEENAEIAVQLAKDVVWVETTDARSR
ncbi:TetR/AcrR family transcriptional regulator [Amycolatopsis sp. NPDC049868]|uniref:TetR/AcrR family transcriptional regulator n=1 Tax=Amycolatopsis sp. NPDC049868 TaxID=3363934 RepID=UPI0037B9A6E0